MKTKIVLFLCVALLAVGCQRSGEVILPAPIPVACSKDAQVCPDGSVVGRTGSSCGFAACPPAPVSTTSGIEGVVTIGPSCPVERFPAEAGCEDKPYQATIEVKTAEGKTLVTQFTTPEDGTFKISLAPGTYVLAPVNGRVYPQAGTQEVTVQKDRFTAVTIMFDSGVR